VPLGIILGTANLEHSYGSKGKKSLLTRGEAEKILAELLSSGDGMIETSAGYGNAEKIIGEILGGQKFEKIITKIAPRDFVSADKIIESVTKSLENLGQTSIQTVMLHGGLNEALESRNAVMEGLAYILENKMVERVGYSAYEGIEIFRIKESIPILTHFQLPENIADQRSINSKDIAEMSLKGNQFDVRSIFLQGNLLLSIQEAQKFFPELLPTIRNLEDFSRRWACGRVDVCLAYAKMIPWAHQLVVGVRTFEEFKGIIESLERPQLPVEYFSEGLNIKISDPRYWS
jgi:aryl-alcohol dehydrogenase-like predicted oxidoreductase